ncbi:MAG: hypothetical protein R6X14_00340 [bacterium]
MKLTAIALAAALLLGAACIAPLARTSANDPGLALEFGAGLSEYRGHVFVKDSTVDLGFRTERRGVNVGPYGAARVGYGFRREFGADLTLAGAWGPSISRGDAWAGWLEAALGFKYRPFRSNNLFFAEIGYPSLALGWAGGFPMNRPDEQWSLTARVGTGWPDGIPETITLDWLLSGMLPPNALQLSLGRNLALQRGRLRVMPQAGVSIGFDWSPFKAALSNVTAGVSLSPALRRR